MGWDPKTYLAFGAERTRPAADLLARVAVEQPRRVADPVFHWMMGTGLRPFAAALKSPRKDEFLEHYRGLLAAAYPPRPGGQTIHRFLRLFFVVSV